MQLHKTDMFELYTRSAWDRTIAEEVIQQYNFNLPWKELEIIVDIGAHIGAFALFALQKSPAAKYIGYEYDPEQAAIANLNICRFFNRAYVHCTIISDTIPLNEYRHLEVTGATRLQGVENHFASTDNFVEMPVKHHKITHPVGIFDNVDTINLLKIDCEGCEYKVFDLIPDYLQNRVQHVIGEFHGPYQDFENLIQLKWKQHNIEYLDKVNDWGRFHLVPKVNA